MARRTFGKIDKRKRTTTTTYQASYLAPWEGGGYRSGQRVSRTFSTKADAEGWLASERRRIELGVWDGPTRQRKDDEAKAAPTVREWLAKVIEDRAARGQIGQAWKGKLECYAEMINDGLGSVPIDELSRARVEAWRYSRKLTRTPTSAGHAYSFLHSAMGAAVKDELIEANPCTLEGAGKPKRAREPEPITYQEFEQLLDAIAPPDGTATKEAVDTRIAVLIQASCAMRIGEVLALRIRDVDLEAGVVHVRQAVTKYKTPEGVWVRTVKPPKTPESRRDIHLPPSVVEALTPWMNTRVGGRDALLFPTAYRGVPQNSDVVRRRFKKAAEAIGRPELRTHDLRSAGASWAAQAGATVREVQERLGHTTATMALRYQPATGERDRAIAERLFK